MDDGSGIMPKKPQSGKKGKRKPGNKNKKKNNNKKSPQKNGTKPDANANANDTEQKEEQKEEKSVKEMLMYRPNADKRDPNRSHKFWNKQPVPQMGQQFDDEVNGPIEEKTLDDVRKQPLLLPSAFEWVELDLNDEKEVEELYKLLAGHYVEDDDNRFRFNYSKEFLRWALMVPGYIKHWHLGMHRIFLSSLSMSARILLLCTDKTDCGLWKSHYILGVSITT